MNVKELITILQNYDPILEVVVDGYEGGTEPAETEFIHTAWVDKAAGAPWCGRYGGPEHSKKGMLKPAKVLLIGR